MAKKKSIKKSKGKRKFPEASDKSVFNQDTLSQIKSHKQYPLTQQTRNTTQNRGRKKRVILTGGVFSSPQTIIGATPKDNRQERKSKIYKTAHSLSDNSVAKVKMHALGKTMPFVNSPQEHASYGGRISKGKMKGDRMSILPRGFNDMTSEKNLFGARAQQIGKGTSL